MAIAICYLFEAFMWGALQTYIVYKLASRTAAVYRQGNYWKTMAFGLMTALTIPLLAVTLWSSALYGRFVLLYLVAAALVGVCFGLVMIWLERRYYPGA